MRRAALSVCVLVGGCGDEPPANPPPIGSGSTFGALTLTGADTDQTESSSDASSGSASMSTSTSDADTGSAMTSGDPTAPPGTVCEQWAEAFVACKGSGTVLELIAQCEFFLAEWDDDPTCRSAVEDVLSCTSQQPCAEFLGWEIDHVIPPGCVAEFDASDRACGAAGTGTDTGTTGTTGP